MLNRCVAFGLHIHSEFAIPGAIPIPGTLPQASTRPDIIITQGLATLTRRDKTTGAFTLGPSALNPASLLFEHPAAATYLCTATRIIIQPLPHANPDVISIYLIATALPACLYLRGEALLHASAATLPQTPTALTFAGASASGKSTLLNALMQQGASILAEDSLCLFKAGPAIKVSGLPTRIFLRKENISQQNVSQQNATREASRLPIEVPPAQTLQSARLGAIVILSDAAQPQPPQRLSQLEALTHLLRHTHRPNIPALLNQQSALLARWSSLTRTFPIYLWSPPRISAQSSSQILSELSDMQQAL